MGKPKFSRKKYVTPSHPWQEDRIKEENELIKKYGLKNKREIWKTETTLRRYRGQARTLLAKISSDPQAKKESDLLLMHLTRMNILPPNSNLDDVLALENESILSRRLQTITYLKGLANTPDHARQLICHGHIAISGRKITIPSYTVTKQEENEIGYTTDSPLNDTMHPARPRADFKGVVPIKKEPVKPDEKESPKEEKADEEKTVIKEETKSEEKTEEPSVETPPSEVQDKTEETPNEQTKMDEKTKESSELVDEKQTEKTEGDDDKPEEKNEKSESDTPKDEKKDDEQKKSKDKTVEKEGGN